ncbi:S-layer family protein [Deinococcus sp. JMULE3]|uniref:beta strand repeat-containing protein n=1 Tax=Deinococcus sp. JMULE3 TaxID=2518341 RepID=UPI0015767877|nr:GEVED domain-containing protein [Deinococcus sp. JMULE3]
MAVSVDEDFGDAPASYDPTAAASHVVGGLKLGSTIDVDNTGTLNGGTAVTPSPNAVPAGTDNTGTSGDGADEDAITSFPSLLTSASTYSLTVPISGASQAGQVCGWVDYNRNGIFDTGERACASFSAGATSVTLNWSGLSGLSAGQNYVRLRASYDTAGVQNPTGRLDSGEVEDYRLSVTAPPLVCTNTFYALLGDATNGFQTIASLSPAGVVGTTITTVPTKATNLNAALGVGSDGTKLFVVTDVGTLEVYDVTTNTWVASVPVTGYDPVAERVVRLAVTSTNVGYFSTGAKLWSFQTSAPYTITGPTTLTYTDASGLTPTPTIVGSGDFFAGSGGNLYLSVNNGSAGSFLDTFKIRPDGTVTFLGRLNDPDIGTDTYGGFAAIGNNIYGSSVGGRIIQVNFADLTVTQAAAANAARGNSDLTSCSYPTLEPAVTATKTASVVTKASGNTGGGAQTGDTLEYTIIVRNGGSIVAPGTTFSDSIPAGTTYVAGSTTLNGTAVADVSGVMPYAVSGGALIQSPGEVAGNLRADTTASVTTDREATIKFRVIIGGSVSQVSNQATITYVDGPGPILTDGDTVAAGNQATTTTVSVPDLTITKTHTGTWTQADLNRTYTLTVTNSGAAATTGTVTVTDTLPTGLKAYRISGTGWTCTLGTLTCTRSDSLAPGASYPPITLVVDVDTNAPASVTNSASVSGGGETNTANNTATDPTSITATATGTQNCSVLSSASPTSLNFSGAGTLVSGTANTQGAVYRFSNVATGVDALVTVTNLSATSATLLQGGLSALLTTSSSAFVDYKVDLVQAGTSTPITPIDVVAYSFDIDGVGVGNPLSDYAQFTGANSVFLNSPTRLTLTGLLAAQSATYVGYNDTVNDPRNAAGGVYLDVNTFTLRAGVQGATSSATRGVTFDLKTSNSSSFTLINCSDQTAPRTADLSVTKTDGVTSVNAAGTTTYTITVSNAGPNSTTATLTDPVVTGLTKTGVTCTGATGGAVCPTSPTVSGLESGLALGKIPSGATLTFSVTANVTATSGSVSNTVTVAVPSTTIEPSTTNNSATDTDTVTPVADLSVTKTNGVSGLTPLTSTIYTIRVTNNGPSSVTGATLSDPAVAGLTVTSVACSGTPGQCAAAPTIVQLQAGYALPALASGQFYEIRVTATVTATSGSVSNTATVAAPGGTTDPTPANNSETDTDTIAPVSDLAIDKSGAAAVGSGGVVTYTLRVWNNGPSSVSGVSVTDSIPAGFTVTGISCAATGTATCGTQSFTASSVTITSGTLSVDTAPTNATPDGNFLTYTLTGTAPTSGTLSNTASVVVPGGVTDGVTGNNTSGTVTTLIVDAVDDAAVNLAFGAGGTVTVLGNDTLGAAAATTANVTVSIVDKGGLTGLSVNGGQLNVPPGTGSGSYTVTYQICSVTTPTACDTATVPINIGTATADVSITKTAAGFAQPGDTITYTLTVTNAGPNAADGVSVTDTLPTGVTYVSSTPAGAVSGSTLTWTLGTLPAGAQQAITVVVTAPDEVTLLSTPATRTLTNTASVSTTTTETNGANNAATAVTQMVGAKLTKSVRNVTQNTTFGTSGGGLPGEVLEYCIAFENFGGAALPNFVVTDHVPGNTNAQAGGYDAEEASAATGFGVKLTRSTASPTTSYLTSGADGDAGALSSTGGSFGRGTMTVNLGALAVGEQGSVCFRTAIR